MASHKQLGVLCGTRASQPRTTPNKVLHPVKQGFPPCKSMLTQNKQHRGRILDGMFCIWKDVTTLTKY